MRVVCRTSAFVFLIALVSSTGQADVIHVPGDYPTIQAAVQAATAGDEIVVAPGTYVESVGVSIPVTIRSTDPNDPAVVAATTVAGDQAGYNQCVFVMLNPGASGTVIDGLTLRDGGGFDWGARRYGGGILIEESHVVVRRCVIESCSADDGGAVAVRNLGSADFDRCVFRDNVALRLGGAIHADTDAAAPVRVMESTFINNVGTHGGGAILAVAADFQLIGSMFLGNDVPEDDVFFPPVGGGAVVASGTVLTIAHCDFISNSCKSHGGALWVETTDGVVQKCRFVGNVAEDFGGAILSTQPGALLIADCVVTNCVGGRSAVYVNQINATIRDCHMTANDGGDAVIEVDDDAALSISRSWICASTGVPIQGEFDDAGGNVFTDPCPPSSPVAMTGACCLADGCVITTLEACADAGGLFLGSDSDCAGCPALCPGDVNGDGAVTVDDLLVLLSAWGACG